MRRHGIETISALLNLCEGNLNDGILSQRPNNGEHFLNTHSSCKWFKTPWRTNAVTAVDVFLLWMVLLMPEVMWKGLLTEGWRQQRQLHIRLS